ncbi:class I SAM-dependent methyltransferase [Oceanirhabdus sp. W0125-5]|uniref:class I SAM-dependent methyltransferase n=1 Tax=Oceanirhabdus sp. W0125-5 TaxID=2999116 RepID=UPI0022F3243D|nr:class I SAM-dependent methyltransferase [Oceanirhabdus sp. W0125-5]WBW99019.1 methyltransferase domain-containing protein [Oceanirhabdus sp. W0125-5]
MSQLEKLQLSLSEWIKGDLMDKKNEIKGEGRKVAKGKIEAEDLKIINSYKNQKNIEEVLIDELSRIIDKVSDESYEIVNYMVEDIKAVYSDKNIIEEMPFELCYFSLPIVLQAMDVTEKLEKYLKIFGLFVEGYDEFELITSEVREKIPVTILSIYLMNLRRNNRDISKKDIEKLILLYENVEVVKNKVWNSYFKVSMEEMGQFFDKRSGGYDQHMKNTVVDFDIYYKKLSEPIRETSEKISILDLGCGTGLELEGVFEKAIKAHITGIDMSKEMMDKLLERYKKYENQINLIVGSYLDVPFGEEKYDYALSSMTIHHFVPDVKLELYKKIRRSIKKGGCYIEGDYVVKEENANRYLKRYYEIMELLDEDEKGLYHIDIPFSMDTQKELFMKAGFSEVEVILRKGETAILVAKA